MSINPVGGVSPQVPKSNPLPAPPAAPDSPSAQGGEMGVVQPNKTAGTEPSRQPQSTAVSSSVSSSSTSSVLFERSSEMLGNVALALWILSMLLERSDEQASQADQFLLGLAAGLMMAAESKGPNFFFSSSNTSASTQALVGPQNVDTAYNTEIPSIAANPSSASEQSAQQQTTRVSGIDTHA